MSAEGNAWRGRAVDLGRRLGLLEVYIRERGLTPLQAPVWTGSQDAVLAHRAIAGCVPALSGIERRWELLEHYVAVLEQRRERAEVIERGEDPGPWLRLVGT